MYEIHNLNLMKITVVRPYSVSRVVILSRDKITTVVFLSRDRITAVVILSRYTTMVDSGTQKVQRQGSS